MPSSSPHSVYLDWFLKLSAVLRGDKWAEGKFGSEYDKHFDRLRLFDYLPGSNKSESAYKFHLGKSMNNVIGITDLHQSNGQDYLSGHNNHLSSLLLFVICIFGHVVVARTE